MISLESTHRHRFVVNVETSEANCLGCPLVLEADELSVNGIRADPARADRGRLGTGDLAQKELNGIGFRDLETESISKPVDYQGRRVRKLLSGGTPHDFSAKNEEYEDELAEDIRLMGGNDLAVTSGLKLFRDRVKEINKDRNRQIWNAYCELAGKPQLRKEP